MDDEAFRAKMSAALRFLPRETFLLWDDRDSRVELKPKDISHVTTTRLREW